MIVYIITKGEYSGYHICGVADTPEKAKRNDAQIIKFAYATNV